MDYEELLRASLLSKQEITSFKPFVVYLKTTGKIIRRGYCPTNMIEIQANTDDEGVLGGEGYCGIHMVNINTKQIINKSQEILDAENIIENNIKNKEIENKLITDKMNEILRVMAIEELKKEGKL